MSKFDRGRVESYLDQIERGDAIAIIWTIEDVYAIEGSINTELTEDEARRVLRWMTDRHDAVYGVNWDTVEFYARLVISERK